MGRFTIRALNGVPDNRTSSCSGAATLCGGVDLGTYDMCPGEVRELSIPSALGYGRQGSRLYRIPGSFRLFWTVELVRSNSVMEGRR